MGRRRHVLAIGVCDSAKFVIPLSPADRADPKEQLEAQRNLRQINRDHNIPDNLLSLRSPSEIF